MSSSKVRTLPFVALLLPLDILVGGIILIASVLFIPLSLLRRRSLPQERANADRSLITIQILNWDGLHLLKECLPSVLDAKREHKKRTGSSVEVVVVDNGSGDGSVAYLKEYFPSVRVVALDKNYGFSGGNNKGLESVSSEIVVFLNNDMSVATDFLDPLLAPFTAADVFAVASQIRLPDEDRREETGNTRARFDAGFLYLWHDSIAPSDALQAKIPVFWAGGGACAVDVRKFRALGGFDRLYSPAYVEDVDISWQARKRGWRCLLAPKSDVIHRHRGTSRAKFGDPFVDGLIRRNLFLFVWKNITSFGLTLQHVVSLPRIHWRAILQGSVAAEFRSYTGAVAQLPLALQRRMTSFREYGATDRELLESAK